MAKCQSSVSINVKAYLPATAGQQVPPWQTTPHLTAGLRTSTGSPETPTAKNFYTRFLNTSFATRKSSPLLTSSSSSLLIFQLISPALFLMSSSCSGHKNSKMKTKAIGQDLQSTP